MRSNCTIKQPNSEHVLSAVKRSLQYLVGPPFAAITASARLGMDSTNLWQSAGVIGLQSCLMDTFSCSKVVGRQAATLFFTILQRFFMGSRSGEFVGRDRTGIPLVVKHFSVDSALWAGAKSCWNVNSSLPNSCSAVGSRKCSKT